MGIAEHARALESFTKAQTFLTKQIYNVCTPEVTQSILKDSTYIQLPKEMYRARML